MEAVTQVDRASAVQAEARPQAHDGAVVRLQTSESDMYAKQDGGSGSESRGLAITNHQ